ncbi:MAG: serine/threonine-protein kinase [Polyangiaceae bacterium]
MAEGAPPIGDDPHLGLEIEGALRLDRAIGVGTTGKVYRAVQLGFERFVAVKILHRFLMQAAEVRQRFHREARLLARLVHPHIVRVLGSGELPQQDSNVGGEAYLVYEYLEGWTLRERLLGNQRFSPPEAVNILRTASDAIAVAHDKSIVHRDLKPENLMSVARGNDEPRLVVLDFGLARALDSDADPLTREGAILGTPQYMSPEAARGEATTPASDVYALACILHELLTGVPPFHGGSPISVLARQASEEPPRLPQALGVPEALSESLRRNLAKDPALRCRNAGAFSAELAAIAAFLTPSPENQPQMCFGEKGAPAS